jgi:HipA-like protein
MRCGEGLYYVVKFMNNPQHLRTLANEMFATRLAGRLGICVPQVDVVEVQSSLIERTPALAMELGLGRVPCAAGKQFGSKFPGNPSTVTIYPLGLDAPIERTRNMDDFLGILVFDKWVCQTDRRQAIFVQEYIPSADGKCDETYQAMMIDQGFCFNGGCWNFPDAPLHSLYADRRVYGDVVGIESFDPWLDQLETKLSMNLLYQEALQVPTEWYGGDHEAFERLIERLDKRRTKVRELIWATRNACRRAFPNWNKVVYPVSITKAISRENDMA